MLKGNKGEWSEPYALLKLLADGKLFLGDDNFEKILNSGYNIIKIIRHEKDTSLEFSFENEFVLVKEGLESYLIPLKDIIENSQSCFDSINSKKNQKGPFEIPKVEAFLSTLSIKTLKAKSKLKNDITIKIQDPNTFLTPDLGFSIKSQLGQPSTLVNPSGATQFTYVITGKALTDDQVSEINNIQVFSKKIELLNKYGSRLEFEIVDHEIFRSNLQTVDFNFDKILAEILLLYYSNSIRGNNSIAKFVKQIEEKNSIGYNLNINSSIYEMIVKKFLTDYALGMRAGEVWKKNYQATGGYLIVKKNGELICYHFYFTKNFEDYLFKNTKLETPDDRIGFGKIYEENGKQKIKLNLQIRFIK